MLLDNLGPSIADLFFVPENGGLSWIEFLRGFVKCCGRMPASMLLNTLLRVFATTFARAGLTLKLEFESGDADCKISGFLRPIDVLMIFGCAGLCGGMLEQESFLKGKRRFSCRMLIILCCRLSSHVLKLVVMSIFGIVTSQTWKFSFLWGSFSLGL